MQIIISINPYCASLSALPTHSDDTELLSTWKAGEEEYFVKTVKSVPCAYNTAVQCLQREDT